MRQRRISYDDIMKEHTRDARSTRARGCTVPLLCRNVYMVRRVKCYQDGGKLTASVTNLDTSLANVNGDDFPHGFVRIWDVTEPVKMRGEGGKRVR